MPVYFIDSLLSFFFFFLTSNKLCIIGKGKKTRERELRKLVQQVTKKIEKGIDNKADNGISDKGETLKQILKD